VLTSALFDAFMCPFLRISYDLLDPIPICLGEDGLLLVSFL